MKPAFQNQMREHHCWGCGTLNEQGLQIKSYWSGSEAICTWKPSHHHMAGPKQILNGGIIATVIDCHSVCTAMAAAHREEKREIGSDPLIWYVTGSLNIKYLHPTPINEQVILRARVEDFTKKKTSLTCSLSSQGKECATAEIVAVRVPSAWVEQYEL